MKRRTQWCDYILCTAQFRHNPLKKDTSEQQFRTFHLGSYSPQDLEVCVSILQIIFERG